jgi:general secretion pathway protein A
VYETFYGLRDRPFSLTPDPRYLYMTPRHREALSNLTYGIVGSRAITLLIGDAGTGKTTLVRAALAKAQPGASYVVVNNPTLTRAEFVRLLASEFKLSADAATSKAAWLLEFERLLRRRHADGLITALVLDEAQSLPDELLEEVRLLSNIETTTDKLLPIVLTGQPELARRLNQPSLRQLKQRIALRCDLAPFDLHATAGYICSRLQVAGGTPNQIFTRSAVSAIHEAAQGIPRTINVLCDNALLSGFASGDRPVGHRIVAEVCRDFEFGVASTSQVAAEATGRLDAPATVANPRAMAAAPDSNGASSTEEDASPAGVAVGQTVPPASEKTHGLLSTRSGRPRRASFLWLKH